MLKKFTYYVLFNLARLVIYLIALLPHKLCLILGSALGRLAYYRMKSRRQVALDNLKLIYGETLTPAAREETARENFSHLGGAALEVFYAAGKSRKNQDKLVCVHGEENLKAALAQGKGTVIFSAHMGNFILMGMAISRRVKVKFLFRDPNSILASRIYRWIIQRIGVEVIADNPRHACALQSFLHLRSGGVLGILIDQVETGGLYVDFMGKPAGSTLGAANMSLRRKAPLVPLHCYRTPDKKLHIEIEPEHTILREGKMNGLLEPAVASMNKVVEKWVRQHPTQWFWGHRRWRSWRK